MIREKEFFFPPGVTVKCHVPVPGHSEDEAFNKQVTLAEDLMNAQVVNRILRTIDAYENSGLPEKFLIGQKIIVRPFHWSEQALGSFSYKLDLIELDTNAFSIGVYGSSGEYLYGHENGHRIMYYKKRAIPDAITEVMGMFDISNLFVASEFLCDAFGCVINEQGYDFDKIMEISQNKRDGLKRIALRLAWSC